VIPVPDSCHGQIAEIGNIMIDDYPIAMKLRIFVSNEPSMSEHSNRGNLVFPIGEAQI
jgi:hypothetical protein